MDRETREHHGLRIVFMALFWIILRLSALVTGLLALVQWLWLWFEDRTDNRLRRFSVSLARYQFQLLDYLLFNTDRKPFPFDDWPNGDSDRPDEPTDADAPRTDAGADTSPEASSDEPGPTR